MAHVEQQPQQSGRPGRPAQEPPARPARTGIWATKDPQRLLDEAGESGRSLRRAVGTLDLTALGIGAIIGTGIFVIIGEAIGDAGPAIVLSFVLAGLTCVFSALAYAELASAIPVSGSAYTYSYATMGELLAWVIGWDLILEYGVAVAAVAVGWGQYLAALLDSVFGITLPESLSAPVTDGGVVNLPAVFIVLAIAAVLVAGVRRTARTNMAMVVFKVSILLLFCALAVTAFDGGHFSDFAPEGFGGIWAGAALIFFAYIGFDAISTGSEEARDPQRALPRAIIGALLIATLLYIAVALTAVGALPAGELSGSEAPLAKAIDDGAGFGWGADVIALGALVAITSVVLTMLYGQTRVAFSMARDGLLPRAMATVSERTGAPVRLTLSFAIPIALLAAFLPLQDIAELVNIGTLFAFLLVNVGVIWLRRTKPDLERGYRVPLVPAVPLIGAGLCIFLMTTLPLETWVRFGVWMLLGLAIYGLYGYRHSRLREEERGGEPGPPTLSDGRPVGAG